MSTELDKSTRRQTTLQKKSIRKEGGKEKKADIKKEENSLRTGGYHPRRGKVRSGDRKTERGE